MRFWRRKDDLSKVHNAYGNIGGEVIPDKIGTEPITAFRTWYVTTDQQGLGLRSLHRSSWYWQVENTAECLPYHVPDGRHKAPHPACSCGMYSQLPDQPLSEWEGMRQGRVSATGTIELSGLVIVCEKGYKSEHAKILSPVMLDVSCVWEKCMNDVTRVELSKPNESMRAWCPEHNPTAEHAVLIDSKFWLEQACVELAARYPGVEFLHWQ